MENQSDNIENLRHPQLVLKSCRICSQDNPYPEDYITSYLKMKIGSICKECRKEKKKKYNKTLGRTEKALNWHNSVSKFFRSSTKPKKSNDDF